MIQPEHLVKYVIRPVLEDLNLYSQDAEDLILGTACVESECGRWLHQLGNGPALGIFQCEPDTHQDIWTNFLAYHPELRNRVLNWTADARAEELVGNLFYATAICRIHYFRFAEPIPNTLLGQAHFWKIRYNTRRGAGTEEDYIAAWKRFVPVEPVAI